uniref:Neurotransmitter-gated ion-channel ligand-binding domain-containing protein n=1 Tax=Xiphophorus maculatus TaxID=8083 RepID=A0A3B5QIQ4_XIPMA
KLNILLSGISNLLCYKISLSFKVNCSKPDQPSLLAALSPVFDLMAIRPVMNQTTHTTITMYFTLYGILGVVCSVHFAYYYHHSFLFLQWWTSEFSRWDPVQCGTNNISIPKEKIWLPDIVINEFMEENKAPSIPYMYLFSDGRVHEALPLRVVSSCNLDIYAFPFDIQNCSLTFNSYIYYAIELKIILGRDAELMTVFSKDVMTTMGEWTLVDITAQKIEINDKSGLYPDMLAFYIRVQRRSIMYVVTLLLPSCFLITLDLFSFLLPPESTDRSSFKMTIIFGYTVFLLMMNDLLPITGNTIPLINVFFSLCLVLMVASLLETIFITNILINSSDFSPVPRWIRILVLNVLGCLVCMPRRREKPEGSGTEAAVAKAIRREVEQQHKGKQSSEEWIQVGLIIDRLLFGLYIVFISVSFITIIILWINSCSQ